MKKILFFIFPLVLAATGFFIFNFFLSKNSAKGALQVTSLPKSNVYLNGNLIGQTPLCKCDSQNMLNEGEYTLRLVPLDSLFGNFEEKIKIAKSVLTVVDRIFGQGATSEGSVITLNSLDDSKSLELLALSFPDNAQVFVDSSFSGTTPLLLKNLTESDHEIRIVKNGYKDKDIRIHTVSGYKLTVLAFLGVNNELLKNQAPKDFKPEESTPSASLKSKVLILQTPTGFLRVREDSNLSSSEIGRVYPNETYDFIEETSGWIKISLKDGKTGWVSSQYATKQ